MRDFCSSSNIDELNSLENLGKSTKSDENNETIRRLKEQIFSSNMASSSNLKTLQQNWYNRSTVHSAVHDATNFLDNENSISSRIAHSKCLTGSSDTHLLHQSGRSNRDLNTRPPIAQTDLLRHQEEPIKAIPWHASKDDVGMPSVTQSLRRPVTSRQAQSPSFTSPDAYVRSNHQIPLTTIKYLKAWQYPHGCSQSNSSCLFPSSYSYEEAGLSCDKRMNYSMHNNYLQKGRERETLSKPLQEMKGLFGTNLSYAQRSMELNAMHKVANSQEDVSNSSRDPSYPHAKQHTDRQVIAAQSEVGDTVSSEVPKPYSQHFRDVSERLQQYAKARQFQFSSSKHMPLQTQYTSQRSTHPYEMEREEKGREEATRNLNPVPSNGTASTFLSVSSHVSEARRSPRHNQHSNSQSPIRMPKTKRLYDAPLIPQEHRVDSIAASNVYAGKDYLQAKRSLSEINYGETSPRLYTLKFHPNPYAPELETQHSTVFASLESASVSSNSSIDKNHSVLSNISTSHKKQSDRRIGQRAYKSRQDADELSSGIGRASAEGWKSNQLPNRYEMNTAELCLGDVKRKTVMQRGTLMAQDSINVYHQREKISTNRHRNASPLTSEVCYAPNYLANGGKQHSTETFEAPLHGIEGTNGTDQYYCNREKERRIRRREAKPSVPVGPFKTPKRMSRRANSIESNQRPRSKEYRESNGIDAETDDFGYYDTILPLYRNTLPENRYTENTNVSNVDCMRYTEDASAPYALEPYVYDNHSDRQLSGINGDASPKNVSDNKHVCPPNYSVHNERSDRFKMRPKTNLMLVSSESSQLSRFSKESDPSTMLTVNYPSSYDQHLRTAELQRVSEAKQLRTPISSVSPSVQSQKLLVGGEQKRCNLNADAYASRRELFISHPENEKTSEFMSTEKKRERTSSLNHNRTNFGGIMKQSDMLEQNEIKKNIRGTCSSAVDSSKSTEPSRSGSKSVRINCSPNRREISEAELSSKDGHLPSSSHSKKREATEDVLVNVTVSSDYADDEAKCSETLSDYSPILKVCNPWMQRCCQPIWNNTTDETRHIACQMLIWGGLGLAVFVVLIIIIGIFGVVAM